MGSFSHNFSHGISLPLSPLHPPPRQPVVLVTLRFSSGGQCCVACPRICGTPTTWWWSCYGDWLLWQRDVFTTSCPPLTTSAWTRKSQRSRKEMNRLRRAPTRYDYRQLPRQVLSKQLRCSPLQSLSFCSSLQYISGRLINCTINYTKLHIYHATSYHTIPHHTTIYYIIIYYSIIY